MKLDELLKGTAVSVPDSIGIQEIMGLQEDSREVRAGDMFVAVRGFSTDGHRYVEQALKNGASAVIVEEKVTGDSRELINSDADNRRLLSRISARFYNHPWRKLLTVGVTGTNGKTSTARMLRWIMEDNGISTGLMGTIGHIVAGRAVPAGMTTPGSLDNARYMRRMVDGGDGACVMEVSSHALSLDRVEDVRFDTAVFTNISQDHLDYHRNMEEYLRSKMHIFDLLKTSGTALVGTYSEGFPTLEGALTFGMRECDDYRISDIKAEMGRVSFTLDHGRISVPVKMRVPGHFNAYNAAGAIAAACSSGIPLRDAALSLGSFPGVPGRFQPVDMGQDFLVVVDYAHTPDALERVLNQAALLAEGRVIAVFGAGGDRDPAKRPLMGAIAQRLADVVVVTSDNPRTEDPSSIISDIQKGFKEGHSSEIRVESDRRCAIREAVMTAETGDVVIIAGKGHEDYQILGTEKIHFDDREEAKTALRKAEEQ
ncbi:MAG: UDP-N-acetylmuramoyl-L-alanyl-D-glutamate--2,6-diaminopimelate ligase [Candidatus Aegiribacteria sp.]|nr:UDP-N-acetylmuramoyl-L-alanyl-D-glutamate--2,6-diaminopimelate ligase [Candidatus Aegiribacteria sp.]MBD3295431.1 UDP-N-acetylmuramoyl-L-alanyl-D-glutamate--2,6-diaminopimelate ligase [Candidatus Fermentibacteria bacterium]